MKRAAWLASLVAVAALASAGCAFQVAGQGQGQDEQQVGTTSQGLGQDQNSTGTTPTNSRAPGDNGSGSTQVAGDDPGKPTPDPWRTLVSPSKPTPDPWTTSATDSSQGGGDPSGTNTTQSINTSAR